MLDEMFLPWLGVLIDLEFSGEGAIIDLSCRCTAVDGGQFCLEGVGASGESCRYGNADRCRLVLHGIDGDGN